MNQRNYSREEFEKKLDGNTLEDLLKGREDLIDAILTWNKKWVNFLLSKSVYEQSRFIHMKVDHIIGLGEWLEQANFVKETFGEKVNYAVTESKFEVSKIFEDTTLDKVGKIVKLLEIPNKYDFLANEIIEKVEDKSYADKLLHEMKGISLMVNGAIIILNEGNIY